MWISETEQNWHQHVQGQQPRVVIGGSATWYTMSTKETTTAPKMPHVPQHLMHSRTHRMHQSRNESRAIAMNEGCASHSCFQTQWEILQSKTVWLLNLEWWTWSFCGPKGCFESTVARLGPFKAPRKRVKRNATHQTSVLNRWETPHVLDRHSNYIYIELYRYVCMYIYIIWND